MRAGLALEAKQGDDVIRQGGRQHLQRDEAAARRLGGLIHHAHATAAEFSDDLISSGEFGSGHAATGPGGPREAIRAGARGIKPL